MIANYAAMDIRPGSMGRPLPGIEAGIVPRRKRLGAVVAPKEIDFLANVPKTRSGKIMRRLLKARELGLPEGDTSTLESDS